MSDRVKKTTIQLRIPKSFKEELTIVSEAHEMTLSEFIRYTMFREVEAFKFRQFGTK